MTQVTSTFLAGEDEQPGQPFGFASPAAPPLSTSEPPRAVTPGPVAPPQDFAPPAQQVAPLDQIAPAPADRRDSTRTAARCAAARGGQCLGPDPAGSGQRDSDALNAASEPDTALSPQQLRLAAAAFRPARRSSASGLLRSAPLSRSRALAIWALPGAGAQPGVGAQPAGPQTMRPVAQSPYPDRAVPLSGQSVCTFAPSPYGPNPYATGLYSQDGYYPAPGGP